MTPPPPGRRGAGREAEGAGAGQRPRGTPPPPAPRAPQRRRAANAGDSRLPEAAGAAHGSPGTACQPPSLPSCRPPARCGRESEDGKMATAPRSPSRPRYPPQARGEGLLPPPRERSGLSPPRPSAAAPGQQRARTRMEARAGAASAAGGKATRAPGIRCGGGRRGQRACPLAEPLDGRAPRPFASAGRDSPAPHWRVAAEPAPHGAAAAEKAGLVRPP